MNCFIAVMLSFNAHTGDSKTIEDMSPSYQQKWVERHYVKRFQECRRLEIMSRKAHRVLHIEPLNQCERLWVMATGIKESALDNSKVSSRGARSTMQTYRKYAPKTCKSKSCDLRYAGIYHATKLFRTQAMCDAGAKYNAGPDGSCSGKGGGYSRHLMSIFHELVQAHDAECAMPELSDEDQGC